MQAAVRKLLSWIGKLNPTKYHLLCRFHQGPIYPVSPVSHLFVPKAVNSSRIKEITSLHKVCNFQWCRLRFQTSFSSAAAHKVSKRRRKKREVNSSSIIATAQPMSTEAPLLPQEVPAQKVWTCSRFK